MNLGVWLTRAGGGLLCLGGGVTGIMRIEVPMGILVSVAPAFVTLGIAAAITGCGVVTMVKPRLAVVSAGLGTALSMLSFVGVLLGVFALGLFGGLVGVIGGALGVIGGYRYRPRDPDA
jgi:hypothetical protein